MHRQRDHLAGHALVEVNDFVESVSDFSGHARVLDLGGGTGSITGAIAHLHDAGVDAGFSLSPTQDFRDSTKVIAEIDQSGIGLPERDYYMRPDKESRTLPSPA